MKKTFYYKDELKDDFSPSKDKINTKKLPSDFKYVRKNLFWKLLEFIIYRIIATPLVYFYCKIKYGLRFKNLSNLKRIKGSYFMYCNHTQTIADAFVPSLLSFPRKCKIVTSEDAVSIPGLKNLVLMLGAVPLPASLMGTKRFLNALESFTAKGFAVMIYPEAHIWPYYNGIRPFTDSSFAYPVKLGLPAVGVTTVYRRRRIFKNAPPLLTVIVGKPTYPDSSLSAKEARKKMRDYVYDFMCDTVVKEKSHEHVRYVKLIDEIDNADEFEENEAFKAA